jgi:acetoacetate decarboxylase
MRFALSPSEVADLRRAPLVAEFVGSEMLLAAFQTEPHAIARILPRPLRPTSQPIAFAFVAHHPQTNFGSAYHEGALFLQARLGRETGLYCLAMPVTEDMAMVYGRERFGFPKKIAEIISLEDTGSQVVGRVVRKGAEILRIELEPNAMAEPGDPGIFWHEAVDSAGRRCWEAIAFLFKFFPSPDGKHFDYLPRLVRQPTLFRPRAGLRKGGGRVVLTSTACDPLGEVPVGPMIGCMHGLWDNTMLPGRVVRRVWNVWRFLPHAFFRMDAASSYLASLGTQPIPVVSGAVAKGDAGSRSLVGGPTAPTAGHHKPD